jgi:hypothetical protein
MSAWRFVVEVIKKPTTMAANGNLPLRRIYH